MLDTVRMISRAVAAALVLAASPLLIATPANAQSGVAASEAPDLRSFRDVVNQAMGNMMRDPRTTLELIDEAEALLYAGADVEDPNMAFAEIGWLRSEALTRVSEPQQALPVAEAALARFGPADPRTKLYADILVSLGRATKLMGDYGRALEYFQQAYEVFVEIGQTRSESIVLQSMGSMFREAHQYQRAVEYFIDATERHQGDPALELSARNNMGNAYRELGQYDDALNSLRRALAIGVEMDSAILQARILNNIAFLHVDFGNFDAADQALDQAFALAGDEAEWARFFYGVRAMAAYGRGEYREAQAAMGQAFDGLALRDTTQAFTEYHEQAAAIYQAVGELDLAVAHLEAFKRLDDEARDLAASANTALMSARFDFAEQELQIEQLRTNGLEQALALSNARARQRLMVVVGLVALTLFCLIGGVFYYRALRERQQALESALYEDIETGLPTRSAAVRKFDKLAASSGPGELTVVVALGIERFKHLESALGYGRIAELEREMVVRIETALEPELVALVSPGVLCAIIRPNDMEHALSRAELIRACFAAPVTVGGLEIDVATTAGIATGTGGETVIKNAVVAIEQGRAAYKPIAAFDDTATAGQARNLSLMSCMLKATQNGDMSMHYQPKLYLPTSAYKAAEGLVRWNDSERGFIPPDTFIELAEETGHIRDFTEWSIAQVVEDMATLKENGREIMLAVNISGALISDRDFAMRAMAQAERATSRICFEITETAAMRNPDQALANLQMWREAGIKLAIDDYGAGLSSLAYLRTLPTHELKLDRAFVQNVAKSRRDRMLVKSTADLAHALGLEMTAEGVECEAGLAVLKMFGCDWAQGWALSKALPLPALQTFLDENQVEAPKPRRATRSGGQRKDQAGQG